MRSAIPALAIVGKTIKKAGTVPVSRPLFLWDGSFRESSNSKNDSRPLTSGRLSVYKKERHSAATPNIVAEDMALQGKEGHSPVAPESLSPDIMKLLKLHVNSRNASSLAGKKEERERKQGRGKKRTPDQNGVSAVGNLIGFFLFNPRRRTHGPREPDLRTGFSSVTTPLNTCPLLSQPHILRDTRCSKRRLLSFRVFFGMYSN